MNIPVILALLLDMAAGDPPNRFHPTAWMGSLITAWWKRIRPNGQAAEFLCGAALTLCGIAVMTAAGYALTLLFNRFPSPLNLLATGLALKLMISLRGLDRAAQVIQSELEAHNLPEARRLLSWHLVSRNTGNLTEEQVSAAVIESLAENTSDSIIAPLFFFAIGGLPAAFAYRFVNTADAMLGYRDPAHEWYGKFPARLDDVLNFIPARITGLLITAAAFIGNENARQAWKVMRRDSHLTASPNAGIPMSAMAGALGIKLEKIGLYLLAKEFPPSTVRHIRKARRILMIAVSLAGIILLPVPPAGWMR